MSFWNKIKQIWSKYFSQIILAAVVILLGIFLMKSIENNMHTKHEYENNVIALTSELETWKTKTGELVAEKTILLGDIDLLKQTNEELYDQVKKLKARPKEVVYVQTEIINEVHDTTYVMDPGVNYMKQNFDFSNQFRTLTGFIEYNKPNLNLSFTQDIVKADFTVAIKDSKVYVTSNNPYIQYNDIQGVTVPHYKPKWSIGIGPALGGGFGLINKQFDFYAGISINLNYNFITF